MCNKRFIASSQKSSEDTMMSVKQKKNKTIIIQILKEVPFVVGISIVSLFIYNTGILCSTEENNSVLTL